MEESFDNTFKYGYGFMRGGGQGASGRVTIHCILPYAMYSNSKS